MVSMRILCFMVPMLVAVVACGRTDGQDLDPTPHNSPASPAGDAPSGTSVAEVMNNPSAFVGRRLTVSGEVTEVWAPRAFSIGGEAFLENDKLLVVSREDLPRIVARAPQELLSPTDIVQLTGTIHIGPLADVERQVAFDLPAAAEELWEPQRPVLVAESVIVTPRRVVNP